MKTFQVVVLAIFGIGALIGLVVFATSKGVGGGGDAVGPVVIWGLLPQTAGEVSISELALVDKRFAEVSYVEKPVATFGTDLAQAIAEGTGPDLVIITQEQFLSERAKLEIIPYASMPERTYIDSYVPMAELLLTDTGTYGLPLTVDPLVMYYNRQSLSDAGVASPPTSWEAVNGLAQTLTNATPTGAIVKSVIPFGDYANVTNGRAILSTLFFQAGIPITESALGETRAALLGQTEETGEIAAAALDFYTQFADPAKTVYTWNRAVRNSRDTFLAGDLVFYPGFASERPTLSAANPNLDFDMATFPQPSTATARTTYGLLYFAAIPRASFNIVGATEVAFALSSPTQSSYLAALSSMAPALRSSLRPAADDRYATIFFQEVLRARGWLSPSVSVTDGIFAGMIGNVTSGRRSILESLRSADQSLDVALP